MPSRTSSRWSEGWPRKTAESSTPSTCPWCTRRSMRSSGPRGAFRHRSWRCCRPSSSGAEISRGCPSWCQRSPPRPRSEMRPSRRSGRRIGRPSRRPGISHRSPRPCGRTSRSGSGTGRRSRRCWMTTTRRSTPAWPISDCCPKPPCSRSTPRSITCTTWTSGGGSTPWCPAYCPRRGMIGPRPSSRSRKAVRWGGMASGIWPSTPCRALIPTGA
jgi:hypothetical protein